MKKNNREEIKKEVSIYDFAAKNEAKKVLETFQSSEKGLAEETISDSEEKYGQNVITYGEKESLSSKIFKAYITPFTAVLLVLAAISFITDYVMAAPSDKDLTGIIIIIIMVTVSGSMTLFQSVRSSHAADKLAKMVRVTATVTRQNEGKFELPIEEIVCGDVLHLSAGDMIPADIRLLQTKDLFISESAMTGESNPVEKFSNIVVGDNKSALDYNNLAFMGSDVVSGSATGMVISVGNQTLFGKIAENVSKKKEDTSFELGIQSVSKLLIRFMVIMVTIVFFINGFTKGDWVEAFLFGLSVAVGLTPEMLPMIVTTNLVKGATTLSKRGTVIKNINSIQNFGAIDVLCTDKTGTLTQDKIVLQYHLDADGKEDTRVLKHAYFNSFYQTGFKNLMDVAIIEAANEELTISPEDYEKVDEIPWDFGRRRMSVVIKDKNGKTQMITKGAVEEMLSVSSFVDYKGKVLPLEEGIKQTILKTVDRLNEDGLRVVAVAQKTNPSAVGQFSISDESEMVLIGYLAFLDPPKETASKALKALKENNVDVKVLTGDNALVTRSVCGQIGLDNERIVTGIEVESMDDVTLAASLEVDHIYVKLSPEQKARIVRVLRENGHTVGFMGDGINDASAMKAADVGISVDTAVDIAKESADVILLEKDLMILERGIVSGREIFGNIIKYIKMTASSNFGNVFSVLFASAFLPFLPMLPLQMLFLSLIYDISCISLPWDNVDKEFLEKPKVWSADTISSFMKWIGPTSSIFDITTFILLYFVICPAVVGGSFHTLDGSGQAIFIAVFHAGWFVESLWTQTLVIHALRTPKIPFLQSRASFIVTTITLLGIVIGTLIPYTTFGTNLGMHPLPMNFYGWLALTIAAYMVVVTVFKNIYIKRYGELL